MFDPIHSYIQMDDMALQFLDTPEMQRLRDLKQLGTTYYVFPGASHNRFEHCVGVGHLAGRLIDRFAFSQPELLIDERVRNCVRIAGLCHDIGHGPFSHVFDNLFMKTVAPEAKFKHEEMSVKLIDFMVDNNNIDIAAEDVSLIQDLIVASDRPPRSGEDAFVYEIVANGKTGIDVDKFDYLARDTFNLGIKSSYDYTRLMEFSRVINGEICYHAKEVFSVYEMFHTRYSLFKQIYQHRAAKAIEFMVTDVLVEADAAWNRMLV